MGNEFKFEAVVSEENLEKLPGEVAEVLTNFEDLYDDTLFPWMTDHVKKVYATQGKAAGKEWADYSDEPKYAEYKASLLDYGDADDLPVGRNTTGGLLRWGATGEGKGERLYPSLTRRDHSYHTESIDGASGTYGTTVPHAERLAQTGGVGPFDEKYPPRPILSMSDGQETRLKLQIAVHYCQRLSDLDYDIDCTEDAVAQLAGVV